MLTAFTHNVLRRIRVMTLSGTVVLILLAGCSGGNSYLSDRVDFNFDVKPILSDRCFACHGPDANARQANLRLDTEAGAFAALDSDPERFAIVPGHAANSVLVERTSSTDPTFMMPPPESNLALSEREKAILARWIDQGAEWKPHWSFIPPVDPDIPATDNTEWANNPIDDFVLARLEQEGLTPQQEASKETLIRRITFDLTGLPPTLAEIDAYMVDVSPQAYERVVDRLLASDTYGERMAVEWLDVARYADSHGYQDDGLRRMWPWRDWVIKAFNENLPFDDFVTWQLAGDLLPEPTQEQVLATGFNRNHMQNQEGGAIFEEYRVEYVVDRTNTLSTAFLGLTMQCARCHDHKYDPISQEEYYQLYGFFNNINESGIVPNAGVPSPTMLLPDRETARAIADLKRLISEHMTTMESVDHYTNEGFLTWLDRVAEAPINRRLPSLAPVAHFPFDTLRDGTFPNVVEPDHSARLAGDLDGLTGAPSAVVDGRVGNAIHLNGRHYVRSDSTVGHFGRSEPFSFGLWIKVLEDSVLGSLVSRSYHEGAGKRGYALRLENGRLYAGLYHVLPDNCLEVRTRDPLPIKRWTHVAMTYDGSSTATGLRLFVNGQRAGIITRHDNLFKNILRAHTTNSTKSRYKSPPLSIGRRHDRDPVLADVLIDDFQVFDRRLTGVEVAFLAGERDPIGVLLTAASQGPGAQQSAALFDYYRTHFDTQYQADLRRLQGLHEALSLTEETIHEVMVMKERVEPRPTFVLNRGLYDAPTLQVTIGTPASVLPFPTDFPPNRLGLAQWVLDPRNPLPARVIVNRYWQMYFGRGIVATPDDFGNQGDLPSHPKLLDWLAVRFRESGWDVKTMQKLIVMSTTYRQSSVADPALRERDPGNRLLARGPSYRLPAEMIRDNALAASGLLNRTIGGPSVKPYQPPGLWKELATRNAATYVQDHGDKLYRRGMYTIWKRTTPPPSMIIFDASERNFCVAKRQATSTPLQALVLLNDPQYVEASRMIAERVIKESATDTDARLTHAFRLLTSRHPEPEELALLHELYQEQLSYFRQSPEGAKALLAVGEHARDADLAADEVAAYATVASVIMNFDESFVKR